MDVFDINYDAPATGRASGLIHAPADLVWDVLTGLAAWPEWNPDIRWVRLSGPVGPGCGFRWKVGSMSIASTIESYDPPGAIGWTGHAPGIEARHTWILYPRRDVTRVVSSESFDGLMARAFPGLMNAAIDRALERGVEALKAECERRHACAGDVPMPEADRVDLCAQGGAA